MYIASLWMSISFCFSEANTKELINVTLLGTLPRCQLEELLYMDPIALHLFKTFLKIFFNFFVYE